MFVVQSSLLSMWLLLVMMPYKCTVGWSMQCRQETKRCEKHNDEQCKRVRQSAANSRVAPACPTQTGTDGAPAFGNTTLGPLLQACDWFPFSKIQNMTCLLPRSTKVRSQKATRHMKTCENDRLVRQSILLIARTRHARASHYSHTYHPFENAPAPRPHTLLPWQAINISPRPGASARKITLHA